MVRQNIAPQPKKKGLLARDLIAAIIIGLLIIWGFPAAIVFSLGPLFGWNLLGALFVGVNTIVHVAILLIFCVAVVGLIAVVFGWTTKAKKVQKIEGSG